MIKRTNVRHILMTIMLALLAACSSNNETRTTNAGIPAGTPSSIQYQQNATQAVAAENTSKQLNLIASFDDGLSKAVTNFDVTELADWVSSNSSIANVSNQTGSKGLVFGGEPGTATISATFRGIKTDISFTVTNAQLQQLDISPAAPRLLSGTTIDVTVSGRYSDGSTLDLTDDVTLSSADQSIATISNPANSPARLTGVASGSTTISASFGDISDQATVTVLTADLESLSLSPTTPSVAKGSSLDFSLQALFSDGSTQDVTESAGWTSSNPNFVSVSNAAGSKGDALGVATGSAVITASFQGESASTQATVTDAELSSIEISPPSASIAKGTSQVFTATGIFTDDTTQDISTDVNWTSSNSSVASISNESGTEGEAEGLDVGQSTIGANFQGETATTVLSVTAATVTDLAIEPLDASLALNRVKQFVATATFSDASTQDVTSDVVWSSDDETVATISNSVGDEGLATPVAEGTANISAALSGFTETTELTVVPNAIISSIAVTSANTSIANGTTEQLTATANYDDGSSEDISADAIWSSANESIATVSNEDDEQGLVTGQGVGTTDISASYEGVIGSQSMTVTAALLEGITVSPDDPSIPLQSLQDFEAFGNYSDGTSQDITTQVVWASSNTAVATVSNSAGNEGTASGNSIGSATISATLDSFSGSSVLTVTDALLQSIQITAPVSHIADGFYLQFTATGVYSDGSKRTITGSVTWSSTETDVASISNSGENKGRATGAAVTGTDNFTSIQAELDGVFASFNLEVTEATIDSFMFDPADPSLPVGRQQAIDVEVTYVGGIVPQRDIGDQVTWTSSNSSVASVSPNGTVTAVSADPTAVDITATHTNANDSSTESGTNMVTVTDAEAESLVITPKSRSLPDGRTLQFTAMADFSDGQTLDVTDDVDWDSDNLAAVTIDDTLPDKGEATAVNNGVATITATYDNAIGADVQDSTSLTVTDAVLESLDIAIIAPGSSPIAEGQMLNFEATGTYSDGSSRTETENVTWTSSNTAVASISNAVGSEGEATGLASGTTQIAAGLDGIDSPAISLQVTDAVITQIDVTPLDPTMPKGTNQQFRALATLSDGTDNVDVTDSVTWSSGDPSVAEVSNNSNSKGLVVANDNTGTADITATDSDTAVTGTSEVTATDAVLVSIELSPLNASMPTGYELQFTATGRFSDGSEKTITNMAGTAWSSLDTDVATIDANGLASGAGAGVTTILVSREGVDSSTSLTVSDANLQSIVVSLQDPMEDLDLAAGETLQLLAEGNFTGGISNFDLTTQANWISSNLTAFTVNDGLATATITPGQSDITASRDGVTSNIITLTNTGP